MALWSSMHAAPPWCHLQWLRSVLWQGGLGNAVLVVFCTLFCYTLTPLQQLTSGQMASRSHALLALWPHSCAL
jgi:hypothetical protein